MLKDSDAMATVAVRDLAAAKEFYGRILGLEASEEGMDGVVIYRSGGAAIVVYESAFAGTNRATSVTWDVGDELDDIVGRLSEAGVAFEHYDMGEREGHVHVMGDFRAAWFTDPDGNILHLNNQ
ncbi:MAG: VOC family protein [Gemmatimonadetes bacterium]|nr:VOC family protein [Gemmatimonadota bacterium]